MAIQRNVQQQNDAVRAAILNAARRYVENRDAFGWLERSLHEQGLDPDNGMLAKLIWIPEQDGDLASGIWLTGSESFWSFSATVSRADRTLLDARFDNVTLDLSTAGSARGIGKPFGRIALELLRDESKTS